MRKTGNSKEELKETITMVKQHIIYVDFAPDGVGCLKIVDDDSENKPTFESGAAERKRIPMNDTVQWTSVVNSNQLTISFPNGTPFAALAGNRTTYQVTSSAANGTDKTRYKYGIELLNPASGLVASEDPQIIIDNTALGGKGRKRPAKKAKR
jgi:hypothetical protein